MSTLAHVIGACIDRSGLSPTTVLGCLLGTAACVVIAVALRRMDRTERVVQNAENATREEADCVD